MYSWFHSMKHYERQEDAVITQGWRSSSACFLWWKCPGVEREGLVSCGTVSVAGKPGREGAPLHRMTRGLGKPREGVEIPLQASRLISRKGQPRLQTNFRTSFKKEIDLHFEQACQIFNRSDNGRMLLIYPLLWDFGWMSEYSDLDSSWSILFNPSRWCSRGLG